jgi:uncharacterized membrane protein YfcA
MNTEPSLLALLLIGTVSGMASGLFGIGGGILIIPGLIYLAGFSEHRAVGTSLAVLLPPVGLAATIEYYRRGNVDLRAAGLVAATLFLGAWLGARFGNIANGLYLRLAFGFFVTGIGVFLIYSAMSQLD